jgi:uncharacterized membrane protein YgdD (TMEM256/DUF423 family)
LEYTKSINTFFVVFCHQVKILEKLKWIISAVYLQIKSPYKTDVMKTSTLLIITGILGLTAVMLGAMGSHLLKNSLTQEQLHAFETGVKYQFYHTLLLLVLVLWRDREPSVILNRAIYFCLSGIVFFSGSIYLLSTAHLYTADGLKFLGPITPIGGIFFMAAWICIIIRAIKK